MENSLIDHRYRIREQLGQGGMGIVYLADDELLERQVAVKLLSAAGSTSEWRNRSFILGDVMPPGKMRKVPATHSSRQSPSSKAAARKPGLKESKLKPGR